MSDKVFEQLMDIRNSGTCNLLDTIAVQREANKRDYHDLIIFIEEHKKEYVRFIMFGER